MLQCAFLRAFLGAFLDAVSSAFWCGSVRMGAYGYVWVRNNGCVRVYDEN